MLTKSPEEGYVGFFFFWGGLRVPAFLFYLFWVRASCSPGWSQSHSVDDNGLELLIPLPAFQAQGCHVHYHILSYTRDRSQDFMHARHTSANKATSPVPEESFDMVNNQAEGSSTVHRSSRSEEALTMHDLSLCPCKDTQVPLYCTSGKPLASSQDTKQGHVTSLSLWHLETASSRYHMKHGPQSNELEKQPGWELGEKPGLDQEQWRQMHSLYPSDKFLNIYGFQLTPLGL